MATKAQRDEDRAVAALIAKRTGTKSFMDSRRDAAKTKVAAGYVVCPLGADDKRLGEHPHGSAKRLMKPENLKVHATLAVGWYASAIVRYRADVQMGKRDADPKFEQALRMAKTGHEVLANS